MELNDYRDKILASLATVLISGVGYLSYVAFNAASRNEVKQMISESKELSLTYGARAEVQSMINEAKDKSHYVQDRSMILRSVDELEKSCSNAHALISKNKELIDTQTYLIWQEINKIIVQVEKIRIIQEMKETKKREESFIQKKRGESPGDDTGYPPF